MRRARALLALTLMVGACNTPPEDATGEEIYTQLCMRCHGAALGGGSVAPALGPGSDAAAEDDEYLEFTIRNGRGRMPSFDSLSDAQVDRLIAHIRKAQGHE